MTDNSSHTISGVEPGQLDDRSGDSLQSSLRNRDWLAAQLEASSITAIARECGVSRQAVQQWIKRHNLTATPQPTERHPNRPTPQVLRDMYATLGGTVAVAEQLEANPVTVARWCHEAGIELHARGGTGANASDVAHWKQQRDNGATLTAIAAEAGVTVQTIRRRLAALNEVP